MSLWTEFRDSMSAITSLPLGFFYGGTGMPASGIDVNEVSAMQVSAFTGCVRILSGAVATLPLRVYESLADGSERVAEEHPLDYIINNQPNPEITAADFLESGQYHILLNGNSYAEIRYNGAGQPGGLYLLDTYKTCPDRLKDGTLVYKTITDQGGERIINADDVLHVKGLGMDPVFGMSPIRYFAREVLGHDLAAQRYSAQLFANDSRPGGFLKTKSFLNPGKKLEIANGWRESHAGGKSHRMAVLDGDMTWEKVGINPDEAQFLETRQFNKSQICSIFGVPEHYLGERVESRANMEQRGQEFLTFTIQYWLNKWQNAINVKLFPRKGRNANQFFARFDTKQYVRATYADLLKGVQMGKFAGILTGDEARKELGLQPYSQDQLTSDNPADKLWMPVNMIYVTEDMQTPATMPGGGEGQGGNDQGGGDGGGMPAKTNQQGGKRSDAEIKRYFAMFYPTFRDALGRILARTKRDEGDFRKSFSPVLSQIASAFSFRSDAELGEIVLPEPTTEFIREYIGFLSHRAKDWTADRADAIATEELTRALEVLKEKCADVNGEEEESTKEAEQD